jgi:serine protease DegQ
MVRAGRVVLFVLQFATLGLAIAFVATRLWPDRFGTATGAAGPTSSSPVTSYHDAVTRAAPSVVNIFSLRMVTEPAYRVFGDPLMQGSYAPYRRQRFDRTLGSGVIVREDGYLLTNYHVVAGADDIYIGLYDGRITVAHVVGTDLDTDLAVLRIEGSDFPAVQWASNDKPPQVGDVVLAIGNPFDVGQTVTLGIISATGRDLPSLSRFQEFIQTDAAINFGNSGGALINPAGELVGINTAQAATQSFIGFAIPAGAARRVLEEILDHGYVIRGWMGAQYANAAVSAAPTRDATPHGVQLLTLAVGGPAELAGLRQGDVILRYNGEVVEDERDLRSREANSKPGSTVTIEGRRNDVPFSVPVTLIEQPRVDPQIRTRALPRGPTTRPPAGG